MGDLGNKKIFAKNLKHYMTINNKRRSDVSRDLNIPYTTVTSWCNAEFYPRIDKIELLARYFCIQKSDLVENREINLQPEVISSFRTSLKQNYGDLAVELLNNFEKLNYLGQKKANDNIRDLTKIKEYTDKKTESQEA